MRFKGRGLITLQDYSSGEIEFILRTAMNFKERYYAGERIIPVLEGRSVCLIFQKPSTRTRVSFEVAVAQLGGHPISLNWFELQLGRGETIADTARVLSKYVDCIGARVYRHEDIVTLAEYSSVPVVNLLSDKFHPCQALADLMTILEWKGRIRGVNVAWVGDGNNVAHSLMVACSKMGANIRVATPRGYEPDREVLEICEEDCRRSGGSIMLTNNPIEAVRGADVVYTDVWVSMGQEEEAEKRMRDFRGFQVNRELLEYASENVMFMHCLPAHRGVEVTDDVIDGSWSAVWDQAENRLHTEKAVLSLIL